MTMPSTTTAAQELPATQPSVIGKYRWVICALLFLATTINYIDRQILALIKPILDKELGWTNEDFGNVMAAFQGAYAVGLLLFGYFIDRIGTKLGYALSIVAWSLAAIGHSLVGSMRGFFYARISLGLGEGGNFPAAIKAVASWFPKRERAFATSIFNAGTNVGAIAAPAVVPAIALTWGWQAAFVAAGIAGLIWLALWLPFYDVPEKIKRLDPAELDHIRSDKDERANEQGKVRWGEVIGYRQTWAFIVAKFLTDPVWWFFLTWLPDFFKKTRGLDIKNSGHYLVVIYSIVTVLSIAGGYFTGFLSKRGMTVTRARKTGMLIFALLVVPVVLVKSLGNWPAVLVIGLACSAHQAWSATIFTTVSDMFPKRAVASVIGIGGMAGAVGGILIQKYSGRVLDHFQASGNVTAGYALLFTIFGSAYLVAFAINHLLAPKFEPIQLKS
jgi:ACS family hexuronate transporter-like MFS transporter